MGAARAASSGKSRGCGPLGGGQPAFRRSCSLDCACWGALFDQVFAALSDDADFEYVIVDGTIVRVHQHGTGAKGGTHNQAIGRSRGGLTTKIVALVDALGNLVRFVLLPGQR